ncbi:zinc ribbon domain-containing protein [Faecalibacterium sp. IP-1-18]|uniref:zinc ribbon domain-containing protein n=1 Tax=Faecalibacterium sp. IP-1-18 TaxID=2929488 RepID=UPI002014C728|nr:zinc ribbon domain-containing protein [Faecalibacterium sp. IP-1-18]UQK55081.1 zinc ribbon domain-containing protein [Faecalibacterium sp. IP-1-18]
MDFNKIKAIGLEYAEKGKNAAMDLAEKGKNAAMDLAEKGKTQALLVNEQGKLLKAQRQLGALVYSLAKGKEENQPLVDKYIEMIDTIEQEITRLKATLTPAEAAEVDYEAPMEEAEEAAPEQPAQPARKTCPQCGAPVSDDALFCNKCGAQL